MVFHLPTWGSILDGVLSIDSVWHSTFWKTWWLIWQDWFQFSRLISRLYNISIDLITDIIPLQSYDVRKATAVCCILAPTGGDSSNSLHSPLWLRGAVTLPASDWSVSPQLSPLIGRYADWSALFSGQAPAPVRKLTENHNCECQVTRRRREGRTGLHSIRANFDSKIC